MPDVVGGRVEQAKPFRVPVRMAAHAPTHSLAAEVCEAAPFGIRPT
jgi:hypothetical protein